MLAPDTHIGRPRKFQDIADFEAEIAAYFAGRDAAEKPYTMHGLARALGCSRNTILNYEQYDDASAFVRAIKEARERVAEWTEDRLHTKGYHPASAIFSLKNNFGWKDVQEVQHQGGIGVMVGVAVSEELRRAIVPQVPEVTIDQIPSINADRPALETGALEATFAQAETSSALSPRPETAVSGDRGQAKATPMMGVSPASVA